MRDIGKHVREMFPEQTRSILSILLWTVLYVVNLVLVLAVAHWLGFNIFVNKNTLYIYLAIAAVPFLFEMWIIEKLRGGS